MSLEPSYKLITFHHSANQKARNSINVLQFYLKLITIDNKV